MPEEVTLTKEEALVAVGRRFGSDGVALEASEAGARWARDEAALASYGFGPQTRARFETDRERHETLRASRSRAVANKKSMVATRDQHISQGWAWVDRVLSMLGVLALTDSTLAVRLATAKPGNDAALEAGILALAKILADEKDKLPADAQAEQRLTEAEALAHAVAWSPGSVHTSKSQTVADTIQLDLLDGKIYLWIRELNKAARRAIRNGDLQATLQEYMFHHLHHSGSSSSNAPAEEPPAVRQSPPAAGAPASETPSSTPTT